MAYNAITEKNKEFAGLQDHELFAKCFDSMGNDHPITEVIRRYIVLRDTWAGEERRMLEAQQSAKRKEAEWKELHPFKEVRVCAITLRSGLSEAINSANEDQDNYSLARVKLFDTKGEYTGEDIYVSKDEEGTYIDLEFKNF